MKLPVDILLNVVPCPRTVRGVCALLDVSVEQWGDRGLRIYIRGAFRGIGARERVQLLDWHFLQSWSARFQVMGVFALPFDEDRHPWPAVRYLLYTGPAELWFALRGGCGQVAQEPPCD